LSLFGGGLRLFERCLRAFEAICRSYSAHPEGIVKESGYAGTSYTVACLIDVRHSRVSNFFERKRS
jgi:hypothetical protein